MCRSTVAQPFDLVALCWDCDVGPVPAFSEKELASGSTVSARGRLARCHRGRATPQLIELSGDLRPREPAAQRLSPSGRWPSQLRKKAEGPPQRGPSAASRLRG